MEPVEEKNQNKKYILIVLVTVFVTAMFLSNSLPPQFNSNGMPPSPPSFFNHISKTFGMFATAFQNLANPPQVPQNFGPPGMPPQGGPPMGPPGMGNMPPGPQRPPQMGNMNPPIHNKKPQRK